MLSYSVVYFTFIYFVGANIENSKPDGGQTKSIPAIDVLLTRIEGGSWNPDEGECLKATLDMLRGVKNNTLWAVWAWESMQPPVGSLYGAEAYLGSYDQCLKAPWVQTHPELRSQYCLLEVKSPGQDKPRDLGPFENAYEYYKTPSIDGRRFNHHFYGVCFPSLCGPSSITKLAQHLLDITHLPGVAHLDTRNCEKANEEMEFSLGFYAFWSFVGLLIATAVYSTLYNRVEEKTTFSGKITNSFNLKRNYNSLFTVGRDEVKVMHGMRFLTAAIVVMIHDFFYQALSPILNGLELNQTLHSKFGLTVAHIDVIVDTFFAMSGLLIVRGLLTGKQKNIFHTIIKRYLRLIGPYAFCVAYILTTVMYMDRGPFWKPANRDEQEVCQKNWWKSILMMNHDADSLCHVVTWYIACDFQLAIVAIALFCIFRRNKKLATGIAGLILIVSTLHLGYTIYSKNLDILPFTYRTLGLKRNYSDLRYTYTMSHVRVGAYLVGMVMGYIITTYKPSEHRKIIGKTTSIILASVSLLTMYMIMAMGVVFQDRPYDPVEAGVVVSTNRIIWATAICCLIGVSEYGSLTLIPDFLGWSGFVPLSKLSYCLYLVHPLLIQLYKYNARAPTHYQLYLFFVHSFGALVLSCLASLVLHLTLEAPLINLSNEIFAEKKKIPHQNGTNMELNHNGSGIISQECAKKNKLL